MKKLRFLFVFPQISFTSLAHRHCCACVRPPGPYIEELEEDLEAEHAIRTQVTISKEEKLLRGAITPLKRPDDIKLLIKKQNSS